MKKLLGLFLLLSSLAFAQGGGQFGSGAGSGGSSGVTTFNGRSGTVLPATGDYSFSQVSGLLDVTSQITGNIPVANLNSGTGASATTAWCGNATWCSALFPTGTPL